MCVEKILDDLVEREGGFVKNTDDPGGPTRYGITEAVARRAGFTGPIKDLPVSLARDIYKNQYFEVPQYDKVAKLSLKIAVELTDTGVNCGVGVSSGFLQRALNALNQKGTAYPDMIVDGILGPRSLAALDTYLDKRGSDGELVLLRALNALQGAHYIELSKHNVKLETFVYGWFLNRVII